MINKTLMIQGTTSDAGKSIFVAGLCRILKRRGISVVPFKPQNMALNSAVTIDGGEIGRAQAVQAQACGLQAHSDMNPVLIKPNSDVAAQIIIHGKAIADMDAVNFHAYKSIAMSAVLESHQRLSEQYNAIVVEGAGSPAEINLRDRDIANMGFAEAVDCPVLLIADIDRGGVFAHLTGTVDLLSTSEQQRIKGFIINRFRGDKALLDPGLDWLEKRSDKIVYGVLPYLQGLHIESEDSLIQHNNNTDALIKIIVPALPRISNHTDFDALRLHPKVDFEYIGPKQAIPPCDLIILPGSKSVRADYNWLLENNWGEHLNKHLRYGGKLIGICGGFQMLGQLIDDPEGIEGVPGSTTGFGFFDMQTELKHHKQLHKRSAKLFLNNATVTGYEIHCGISHGPALLRPAITNDGFTDGAVSADDQIMGSYLHGLFDEKPACDQLLQWAGMNTAEAIDYMALKEREIDRLADAIEQHINVDAIIKLLN